MSLEIGPVVRAMKPGEVKDGKHTTEWWLAKAAFLISFIMIGLGFAAEVGGWGTGDGTTIGMLLVWLGFASSVFTKLGYTGFRSMVKMQAGNQIAHVVAAEAATANFRAEIVSGDVGPAGDADPQ